MTLDFSKLGPLAESLARAGLPALSTILGTVLPPPYDLVVKPAFAAIAWALGVDPAAPDASDQVRTKVDADPGDAAAKLQTVEQAHKDAAEAAQAELEARLKDTADARVMEAHMVDAKSPIAWAPVVISTIVVLGFYVMMALLFRLTGDISVNQAALLNILLGASVAGYVGVIQFWLGSSSGSREKDRTIGSVFQLVAASPKPVRR